MISAADVAATLEYLVPGFVAVKLFYWRGLQGRRTDLELTLWSVLVAAGINAALDRMELGIDADARLLVSVALATLLGWGAAAGLDALRRYNPDLVAATSRRAWDVAFYSDREAKWIQIWTTEGHIIHGWYRTVALDAEADALDILMREPSWVSPTTNERTAMTGVSQVLIPETVIEAVQFLEWPADTEAGSAVGRVAE